MLKNHETLYLYSLEDKWKLGDRADADPSFEAIFADTLAYPDKFVPTERWARGYSDPVLKNTEPGAYLFANARGLGIDLPASGQYSGGAYITIASFQGDFDARVSFEAANYKQGSTLELAAIPINADRVGVPYPSVPTKAKGLPLRSSQERGDVSLLFDVHGTPPYVSSECDESDGFRIGWNHSFTLTTPRPASDTDTTLISTSDNAYNSYGKSIGPTPHAGQIWQLRLVRRGNLFASYYRKNGDHNWNCSGTVRNDNMPPAAHLRLAAKHWLKNDAKTTPANRVIFSDLVVRAPLPSSTAKAQGENPRTAAFVPTEVALPSEVKDCNSCNYFWPARKDSPNSWERLGRFGPYPVMKIWDADKASVQPGAPQPAVLKGCRKAPIMQIGINPNLKNFSMMANPDDDTRELLNDSTKGVRTIYPVFEDTASYAKYYRHVSKDKHLYRVSLKDMEKLLDSEKTIYHAKVEKLLVGGKRNLAERKIASWSSKTALTDVKNESGQPITAIADWKDDENFLVLQSRPDKDAVVAGYITRKSLQGEVEIENKSDTYYLNAQQLCKDLGITIGEDLSMHDVVACASVGWGDDLKIDKPQVQTNCLGDQQRYVLRQALQSRPAAIVFSGQAAMRMFVDCLNDLNEKSVVIGLPSQANTNDEERLDILEWLRQQALGYSVYDSTAKIEPIILQMVWPTEFGHQRQWNCRLIPMPHFSYSDNFVHHIHWREAEHLEFIRQFPEMTEKLKTLKVKIGFSEKERFITPEKYVPFHGIRLAQGETMDALLQLLGESNNAAAKDYLEKFYLNPNALVKKIYEQLQEQGSIVKRPSGAAFLERTQGSCSYCTSFEKNCDYAVPSSQEADEKIVQSLLNQLKPYTYPHN